MHNAARSLCTGRTHDRRYHRFGKDGCRGSGPERPRHCGGANARFGRRGCARQFQARARGGNLSPDGHERWLRSGHAHRHRGDQRFDAIGRRDDDVGRLNLVAYNRFGLDLRAKQFDQYRSRIDYLYSGHRRKQSRQSTDQRRHSTHAQRCDPAPRQPARHDNRRRRRAALRNASPHRWTPDLPRAIRRVAYRVFSVVSARRCRNRDWARQHDALRVNGRRRHHEPTYARLHRQADDELRHRQRQLQFAVFESSDHRFSKETLVRRGRGLRQQQRALFSSNPLRRNARQSGQRQHTRVGRHRAILR